MIAPSKRIRKRMGKKPTTRVPVSNYKSLAVDLGNVAAIKGTDVSKNFQRWKVEKESDISSFVNAKLSNPTVAKRLGATQYNPGDGFYLLTKRERIQYSKILLVEDKDTGLILEGKEARVLLNMTDANTSYRVEPHNLGKYNVYSQSSSENRILVRGSWMLYRKSKSKATAG